MFEGVTTTDIETTDAVIHTVHGGAGPPVLLLHGYPQTHVMWHRVAPALAEAFTVVTTDLRGRALPCGHFPAAEAPAEVIAETLAFLKG